MRQNGNKQNFKTVKRSRSEGISDRKDIFIGKFQINKIVRPFETN